MKQDIDRPHQQTFDQGRLRALELAFTTFMSMQDSVPLKLFNEVFAKSAESWTETTLDIPVSDQYRAGMDFGSRLLLAHLSKESKQRDDRG